jgi:hypothetical protein
MWRWGGLGGVRLATREGKKAQNPSGGPSNTLAIEVGLCYDNRAWL